MKKIKEREKNGGRVRFLVMEAASFNGGNQENKEEEEWEENGRKEKEREEDDGCTCEKSPTHNLEITN